MYLCQLRNDLTILEGSIKGEHEVLRNRTNRSKLANPTKSGQFMLKKESQPVFLNKKLISQSVGGLGTNQTDRPTELGEDILFLLFF